MEINLEFLHKFPTLAVYIEYFPEVRLLISQRYSHINGDIAIWYYLNLF